MNARISITRKLFATLESHMKEPEQVAFGLAQKRDANHLEIVDLALVTPGQIASQSDHHVDLDDDARPRLIQWAWERGLCLVEAHSHGENGFARFSGSDLHGFSEWVPHLWWRLQGRPYAALVRAGEEWDALAWFESPTEPEEIRALVVEEQHGSQTVIRPSGETVAYLTRSRLARSADAVSRSPDS